MNFLNLLVASSLRNPLTVCFISFLFCLYGIYSVMHLKIDALPDITNKQVQIVTSAPSLSALEIEEYITYPVERGLAGVPQLEEIRSISRYGISLVTLIFEEDTNIHLARQWISERLINLKASLPNHYGSPELAPSTTALGEVIQFTVESDRHDIKELTSMILWYINPRIKMVKGVVDVNLFGGEIEEYQIQLDLHKMQAYTISIYEVIDAIRANNILEGGGYIEKDKEHTLISLQSRIRNIDDLKKIPIFKKNTTTPIYLENFSSINHGYMLKKGGATSNGKKEVVGGIALMYMGENAMEVSLAVQKELEWIQKTLPEGVEIKIFYNRSDMIREAIRTVILNLSEGALLVVIVLFFVLGSVRAGLIIATIIPICMLFAISIMVIQNAPANLMSMGALDFGLLVDGAVVVVENAYRRLGIRKIELGRDLSSEEKRELLYESTLEVRKATIYGEIILVIVYIPILMLSDTAGLLFRPMAWTVLYALGGAFLFTLTLIPALCYYFLEITSRDSIQEETVVLRRFRKVYESLLQKAFSKGKQILSLTFLLFIVVFSSFFFLGREFIPVLDEGSILLEIIRIPSTGLQESLHSSLRLERAFLNGKFPEIQGVLSKTGSPNLALEPMGIEKTDLFIQLKQRKEWNRSREELLEKIAEELERTAPEVWYGISQPIEMRTNEMVAGIRSDVGIKIFGNDFHVLKQEAEKIQSQIASVKGIADIRLEQLSGVSYIQIIPDREKTSRYGFNSNDIANVIQMISSGLEVDKIIQGPRRISIRLKLLDPPGKIKEAWESLLIPNLSGKFYPLRELARIEVVSGPSQISHEGQERRVLLEFNVRGRDTMTVVEEVERILKTEITLPPGYYWKLGGKFQDYRKATKSLAVVVPLTFLGIFIVLLRAVKSHTVALLLFFNMPFAVIGGILSLWVRGLPFSISAAIGFIALTGVAIMNGLVLVTFTLYMEEEGLNPREAVFQSAVLRFRPVLMTAIVAILGFIPMAISTNPGAEVQRPLATVVIGGLLTNTFLTLFVFPILYAKIRKQNL